MSVLHSHFLHSVKTLLIMCCHDTARMTIHKMREKQAAYNLISNNCQNFATNLLDNIQIGAHREFATSFAVYQRATGDGTIVDLFVDKHPEDEKLKTDEDEKAKPEKQSSAQYAQQIMDEKTEVVDSRED